MSGRPLDRALLARSWQHWYTSDPHPAGPGWLQWVWTTLFCLGIAVAFTLLGFAFNAASGSQGWRQPAAWVRWYGNNLVVSLSIGFSIHLLFLLGTRLFGLARIQRFTAVERAAYYIGVPLVGVTIGWPIGLSLLRGGDVSWVRWENVGMLAGGFALSLVLSLFLFTIFNARARQALAEKQAAEAQLRLLQGQMEPHFLFNTLANVLTLIDAEPARARRMLEAFTDYLRSSLGSLRRDDSSLGRELELAEAYLQLIQMRMEDRLAYRIEVDASLREQPLPPLLLQPLVENAVQHGLEPKVEGGCLRIAGQRRDAALILTVEDDGLGPEAPVRPSQRGNGVALSNLRARLHALYGDTADLRIEATHPGTRVTLQLPLDLDPVPS